MCSDSTHTQEIDRDKITCTTTLFSLPLSQSKQPPYSTLLPLLLPLNAKLSHNMVPSQMVETCLLTREQVQVDNAGNESNVKKENYGR